MRCNVDGFNNGCVCDMCNTILLPREAIKMTFSKLSDDKDKACTGYYTTIKRKDLCKDCYEKILKSFIR